MFLSDKILLFGTPNLVEAALASHTLGRRPLEMNTGLAALARRLDPASSIWLVVGPTATAAMRKATGPQAPPFPVPEALSLSTRFGGSFETVAEMADEQSARNLADLVRGGLAALRTQLAQTPEAPAEVRLMLDGVLVETDGKRARLAAAGPTGGGAALGMISAIAIPSLLRARVSANEAAAIGDIRTVISAEAAYEPAGQGFGDLSCLAKPSVCINGYSGPVFLDPPLVEATEKRGYKRAFHPGPAAKKPRTYSRFAYTATPLDPGRTGGRSFCGDSSGRICFDPQGAAILPAAGACPLTCTALK